MRASSGCSVSGLLALISASGRCRHLLGLAASLIETILGFSERPQSLWVEISV